MTDFNQDKTHSEAAHTVSLAARAHVEIGGAVEVKSFDEQSVVLDTVCGQLLLEGEGLHVGTLDMARGMLVINGKITALYYTDAPAARKKGLFRG